MSASHPRPPDTLGSANRPHLAYGGPPPIAQADIVAPNALSSQARPAPSGCGDPFACYKAFLDTNDASGHSENDVPCDRSGHTCRPPCSNTQDSGCPGRQPNGRERAPQCSTVVSFANRPNGLPLATIVERNSFSTLHSHGSRLSVNCRCHPNQACNAASSVAHSHRTSRNMEETTLHMIQEHANHEQEGDEKIDDLVSPNVCPAMPGSESSPGPDVPITAQGQKHQQAGPAQHQDWDSDNEGKGLKKLLRGVIRHVRSASRRSISHASLQALPSPDRAGNLEVPTTESEPHFGDGSKVSVIGTATPRNDGALAFTDYPNLAHEPAETWAEDCQRSLNDSEASARQIPTIRHVPPDKTCASDESTLPNEALVTDGASTQVDAGPACNTLVGPATGPSKRGINDDNVRYTYDGTPIYRSAAPSVFEYDRTRSISFCSTTSTTYSSTVLGIDLDLHHAFPPVDRRSSTPAWFGAPAPNMSLDEVAAFVSDPTEPAPVHSITSSALPLLLPIAAASGIVQPSNATAMAFYSPTGNLIQAEPCSPSQPQGLAHAYYLNALCFAEPSARPAALPLPTPPNSSIPLPPHLKQKPQQHHCHTRSQIVPGSVESSSPKGCDGIMRMDSDLTPRSGVRRCLSPRKHRKHRGCWPASSAASAAGARSRLPAAAFCAPLRKLSTHRVSKSNANRARDAALASAPATAPACLTPGRCKPRAGQATTVANPSRSSAGFGPRAGWTLRVCFCQPGDGDTDAAPADEMQARPRVPVSVPVPGVAGVGAHAHAAADAGDGRGCLGEACHDHAARSPDDVAPMPARVGRGDAGS